MSPSRAHLENKKENSRGIGGTSGPTSYTNGVTTCDDMMLLHTNPRSFFEMSFPPPTQLLSIDSPKRWHVAVEMNFGSEPNLSHPKNSKREDRSEIHKINVFAISGKGSYGRKRLGSCGDSDLFRDIEELPRKNENKVIPNNTIATA